MALDLGAAMTGLADALSVLPGIDVYPYPPDVINPPAAVVALPDSIEYDETMGRGFDRMEIPVLIILGRTDVEGSISAVSEYLSGEGAISVKDVLEADPTLGGAVSTLRVMSSETDYFPWGDILYLAAIFTVEILA